MPSFNTLRDRGNYRVRPVETKSGDVCPVSKKSKDEFYASGVCSFSFGLLFSCACWCGNVATLALRIIIPTASVCKVDVLTRAAARRMFVDTAAILFRG